MSTPGRPGTLYVVATPIGNLEDITLRAIRILGEVELIASEDTRRTRKLLSHLGLHTPLISYYKGREAARAGEIVVRLRAGDSVALVADAGTPGISDPGALLVRRAREEGVKVLPVPGASALTTLVSVSGLSGGFLFLGFLPSRRTQRRTCLTSLVAEPHHLVFYESPRRLIRSLEDCLAVLGDRPVVIGREMTKLHEEYQATTLALALAEYAGRPAVKGELVLMVEGAVATGIPSGPDLDESLRWHRDHGGKPMSEAVRQVAAALGVPRSLVYRRALALWRRR